MFNAESMYVTAICCDQIFAVGGGVTTERPSTWILPHLRGYIGVSCFVLRSSGHFLVIDTGISVHRDGVLRGLVTLARDTPVRAMIMSRREPDAIVNLPHVVENLNIQTVYCGGALSPLDFFERVDQKNTEAHVYALAGRQVTWVRPGATLEFGTLRLDVLPTTLCVLPKNHFFEQRTRTLFGSDSWGFLTQDRLGDLGIVREIDDRLSRRTIAAYLGHRFDWLRGVDASAVEQEFRTLCEAYDIERICSTFGCVIEGRKVVRHVLLETAEAVKMLSDQPMVDRLQGFAAG